MRFGQLRSKKITYSWLLLGLLLMVSACGRYEKPFFPKDLSPVAVKNLKVTAQEDSITLSWVAPEFNRIGEKLEYLDGYYVYRSRPESLEKPCEDFELVASIADLNLEALKKVRLEYEALGKSTRNLSVADEDKRFSYTDSQLELGTVYCYKIQPHNLGGTLGQSNFVLKLLFKAAETRPVRVPTPEDNF